MNFRVGLGFDFHRFADGRKLLLGGIEIPHPQGLLGHSDADVLLHALSDALLGAAGLNDIGFYFPDTDERFRDASSVVLLQRVYAMVRGEGFRVGNVDIVVLAERPRIAPHVEAIRERLAELMATDRSHVGVKATTLEGRGAIGRGEGIAVQAVVLLEKIQAAQPED